MNLWKRSETGYLKWRTYEIILDEATNYDLFFCQSLIGWDHLIFWIGSSKIKFMDINWKRYKIKIKRIKIRSRLVVREAIYFDRCIPHFDLPRRGKQLKRCSDAFGYNLCRSSNFQSCIEIPSCPLNDKRTPVCVGALW